MLALFTDEPVSAGQIAIFTITRWRSDLAVVLNGE
jgi:hypothetical protein